MPGPLCCYPRTAPTVPSRLMMEFEAHIASVTPPAAPLAGLLLDLLALLPLRRCGAPG